MNSATVVIPKVQSIRALSLISILLPVMSYRSLS
jgi:hypothetical protein